MGTDGTDRPEAIGGPAVSGACGRLATLLDAAGRATFRNRRSVTQSLIALFGELLEVLVRERNLYLQVRAEIAADVTEVRTARLVSLPPPAFDALVGRIAGLLDELAALDSGNWLVPTRRLGVTAVGVLDAVFLDLGHGTSREEAHQLIGDLSFALNSSYLPRRKGGVGTAPPGRPR